MIEVYSNNVTVAANAAVPFNNASIKKGCTAELSAPATIQLNKCGVYMVSCNASASTETASLQLFKNGVAQPQAISVGNTPSFVTLVQVSESDDCKCCTSPTRLQIVSLTAGTYSNVNVCVTKIC